MNDLIPPAPRPKDAPVLWAHLDSSFTPRSARMLIGMQGVLNVWETGSALWDLAHLPSIQGPRQPYVLISTYMYNTR